MSIEDDPVNIPITEELDLHTFQPRDLPELLPAYFEECQRLEILAVRVIHGKGTGALRTGVHALLKRMAGPDSAVSSWTYPAAETGGGWGATLVNLRGRTSQ